MKTVIKDLLAEYDMSDSAFAKDLREALAEQQTPAAPVHPGRKHYEDGDVFERIAASKKQPAQRTWVGLTNAQWQDILDDNRLDNIGAIKNAIEAKLKENNT